MEKFQFKFKSSPDNPGPPDMVSARPNPLLLNVKNNRISPSPLFLRAKPTAAGILTQVAASLTTKKFISAQMTTHKLSFPSAFVLLRPQPIDLKNLLLKLTPVVRLKQLIGIPRLNRLKTFFMK